MKNFLEWNDANGFWVREYWSEELGDMAGEGKMILFPVQREILGYALTFDENGHLPFETVLYSCLKKSGKTAIAAAVGAWYLEEARPGTEIYVIANTQEQGAGRVFRDLVFHIQKRNQSLPSKYRYHISQYRIDAANGSFVQVLSQSFKSVAGSRHALTLWDELWGSVTETDRRTWDEMIPIPTVSNSLRFVATYAGFENESELLWELYLKGVGKAEHDKGQATPAPGLEHIVTDDHPACWVNGQLFTYFDHEPRMPWQTQKYYDAQLAQERPSAFLRFHLNRWVTSEEEFIPIEWWDEAARIYQANAEMWQAHPFRNWPVTIAVDAGLKQDTTALVAVGFDPTRAKVGLVYHRIWSPTKENQVDLDITVEKEIQKLYTLFHVVRVVYDPTQLVQTMLRLKRKGIPTQEFTQSVTQMTAASQLFYDLLKNRNFEAYPDEEVRRHIQMAVAENSSRGFRIVKGKVSRRHHVDAAVALAMACYSAVETGGSAVFTPIHIRNPFLEEAPMEVSNLADVPFELQSEEDYG